MPAADGLAAAEENAARFPSDGLVQYHLAQFYRDAGRLQEMETQLDRAVAAGATPVPNAPAKLHFERAGAEVDRRRQQDPADLHLLVLEVWIRHGLGDDAGARALFREFVAPTLARPYEVGLLSSWWFRALPCALLIGERETALELLAEAANPAGRSAGPVEATMVDYERSPRADPAGARSAIRLRLRLDPRMAPWRDDATVQGMLSPP